VSEKLPSREEAINYLLKSGCSKRVIRHCETVEKLALKIAEACQRKGLNVNVQLVQIGALLHDIGRSKTHEVDHIVAGAEIAKTLGLPNPIICIIERHIGGGIPKEEAENLGLPPKDYIPQTLEEKIVSYADKLVEGSREVPITRTVRNFSKKHGKNHPAIQRILKLQEEFTHLIGDLNANSNPP